MLSMKQPLVPSQQEEIHLLVFLISCSTVSLAPSINTSEFSRDFTVLVMSSIPSFEMNKVNPFPALAASCSLFLKICLI